MFTRIFLVINVLTVLKLNCRFTLKSNITIVVLISMPIYVDFVHDKFLIWLLSDWNKLIE